MVAVLLWWFVSVWNSPPASLGEAAMREAVRRHHLPASVRVINDETLGPGPQSMAAQVEPPPPGQEVVPAPTGVGAGKTAEAPQSKDEGWWRARMAAAREAVARDRVLVAALESRVAALANDIAARDDPAQRAQLMTARQQALAELDRLTTQVAEGERAIGAIEEDARKAGVPPGWIR